MTALRWVNATDEEVQAVLWSSNGDELFPVLAGHYVQKEVPAGAFGIGFYPSPLCVVAMTETSGYSARVFAIPVVPSSGEEMGELIKRLEVGCARQRSE